MNIELHQNIVDQINAGRGLSVFVLFPMVQQTQIWPSVIQSEIKGESDIYRAEIDGAGIEPISTRCDCLDIQSA